MSKPLLRVTAGGLLTVLLLSSAALSDSNDWAEGSPDTANGATRDYYNRAGMLAWQHFMGDWRDTTDKPQGGAAYATAEVIDNDQRRSVTWDVTELVRQWRQGKFPNQGFFLRTMSDHGNVVFGSREQEQREQRPRLVLVGDRGSTTLEASADTQLSKSTYRSLGRAKELRVSAAPDHSLIRFDLSPAGQIGTLSRAELRLYTTKQYGNATIGVFRCRQGQGEPPSKPMLGLASKFSRDDGIGDHPDVLFAADFETPTWNDAWSYAGRMEVIDTIVTDGPRKFQALDGKALRVRIAEGSTGALNTLFKFQEETGREPEEIYFRYYLRLADDWNQTLQGGKLPGISGTYGIAGWGGRKSNGRDGWSARGLFKMTIPDGNPLAGTTPIGTYCYHADMEGNYGTNWVWQRGYRGFLENNRWYSIEQYLKLNTPGRQDGIIRAWVDGRPAFEKTDIRFRHVDKLKIEQVWMNVYHGGTQPSPYDQHLFIDNVVIARQYIGPLTVNDE